MAEIPPRYCIMHSHMPKDILILVATYNGAAFLEAQLDSLLSQTYGRWRVFAHDDDSQDESLTILKRYSHRYPQKFTLLEDRVRCGGASVNFAYLLSKAGSAEYLMFCDQDDVWFPDKIEKTLETMKEAEAKYPGRPILVHTDLQVVDESLRILDESFWHYSHLDPGQNSFNRLLMQNVVTGCTVMINRALIQKALPIPREAIMHDWWLALVAARFGKIVTLPEPTMAYRQHGGNDTGAERFGPREILGRVLRYLDTQVLHEQLLGNQRQAAAFLNRYREELSEEERRMLSDFAELDKLSFWQKRRLLLKYGLLKQGWIRNTGLLTRV